LNDETVHYSQTYNDKEQSEKDREVEHAKEKNNNKEHFDIHERKECLGNTKPKDSSYLSPKLLSVENQQINNSDIEQLDCHNTTVKEEIKTCQ